MGAAWDLEKSEPFSLASMPRNGGATVRGSCLGESSGGLGGLGLREG